MKQQQTHSKMTPAEYRNLINKLEEESIMHAGEPTFYEKMEEIDNLKRECNKKHGLIFKVGVHG